MRGAATRGPITDGAARSAVRAFLRSKNLGAGGIHFRRACKRDSVSAEAELLWDRPHRGFRRCYRHRGVILLPWKIPAVRRGFSFAAVRPPGAPPWAGRADRRVQAFCPLDKTLAQAEFTSAEHVKWTGFPQKRSFCGTGLAEFCGRSRRIKSKPVISGDIASEMTLLMAEGATISQEIEFLPPCSLSRKSGFAAFSTA